MIKNNLKRWLEYYIIKSSGLFDSNYYLDTYPNIKSIKKQPLIDFIEEGWMAGRNPSPEFNVKYYLDANQDVKNAGINPLFHYLINGRQEGRKTLPGNHKGEFSQKPQSLRKGFIFRQRIRNKLRIIYLGLKFLKKNGLKSFLQKARIWIIERNTSQSVSFKNWILNHEPRKSELETQRKSSDYFVNHPLISIVIPVYKPPIKIIKAAIDSVLCQTYPFWELCIANGSSGNLGLTNLLKDYSDQDKRIHVVNLEKNLGIAGNTNTAISLANGEFIAFLDHDDLLAPFALFEVVNAINMEPESDLIYSDEDKISVDGKLRYSPFFKPAFSPDYLRFINYICHLLVVRKTLGDSVGWIRGGFEGAQDFDLILRCVEKSRIITHIPKILYHWRVISTSAAANINNKPYAHHAGVRSVEDHLRRLGLSAVVEDGFVPTSYHPKYQLHYQPMVSIIIPNYNHYNDLEKCIKSIINKSTYSNYEILIVENNSDEENIFDFYDFLRKNKKIRVITFTEQPFNYSKINNFAVSHAQGEILLFLNNDTEVITSNWLENMLEHVIRSDVGVVGAKLFFADLTIQHGGIVLGIGGYAGHAFKGFPGNTPGYWGRLKTIHNCSAVTGACLMIKKAVFIEVEGFDPVFKLACGDVDLCLKVRQKGYLVIWTPFAELYHYESKTRGYEDTSEKVARFNSEVQFFKNRWQKVLSEGDPYYNPNLTLDAENFEIKTQISESHIRSMPGL